MTKQHNWPAHPTRNRNYNQGSYLGWPDWSSAEANAFRSCNQEISLFTSDFEKVHTQTGPARTYRRTRQWPRAALWKGGKMWSNQIRGVSSREETPLTPPETTSAALATTSAAVVRDATPGSSQQSRLAPPPPHPRQQSRILFRLERQKCMRRPCTQIRPF